MNDRDINLEKKKRGRPAIGRGEQINIMVRPEITQAIDAAAAAQDDNPARPEMVRRIIREWLVERGYLPK
ncbi:MULTISPECIES: hypothetical protein [Rhizobium]|uniref:hypothetical protein n=1 Tax=Rhizobium TaxID=379 RepID=UPI001C9181AF|nr:MULTISPECIES: hypothetical protein [Rhizobium]MBY3347311.1 hypothetical protein [Rhizobium laguerreae]MBY3354421.1 hypothetical protein [Rhizobium laguerreae]MBY3375318.1 hypothetical protein [Rhizobium laguerreae]MBY3430548.1 hypothetical protein [Rhizobium laguerreae]MBY3439195.1 hypothetical protein [Rhizobium laguerreae]